MVGFSGLRRRLTSRLLSMMFVAMTLIGTAELTGQSQHGGVSYRFSDLVDFEPRSDRMFEYSSPLAATKMNRGKPYALVLPGVLGEQIWDRSIKAGLQQSSFGGDIEIYDWTDGPLALARNIGGDADQAAYIADRIIDFRDRFPERPLYLVGHSGGCRMAVSALERLPVDVHIERAILLSPCIATDYDLTRSLDRTQSGMVAFWSPLDVPIALPLTAIQGLAHGRLDFSATIAGFRTPNELSREQSVKYHQRLVQKKFEPQMIATGNPGGHFGWTAAPFVARYLAPTMMAHRN